MMASEYFVKCKNTQLYDLRTLKVLIKKLNFCSYLSSFPTMIGLKAFMDSKSVSPIFTS